MFHNVNICRCDENKRVENRESHKNKHLFKKKQLKDSDLFEMKKDKKKVNSNSNNGNNKSKKPTRRKRKKNLLPKKSSKMY